MYRKRYWDAQLFEAVDALAAIAEGAGVPLTELSLRWLLSRPVVDAVLLGASKLDQLTPNIDVARPRPAARRRRRRLRRSGRRAARPDARLQPLK